MKGATKGAQIDQNRTQNASKCKTIFKREKIALQEFLGSVLGRSWGILGAILGSKIKFSCWKTLYLVKMHVFDEHKLSRRVLDRTWPNLAAKSAEHDPKMASPNDPKSTKHRRQQMSKILVEKRTNFEIHSGRPGGMRWPPGGIIGGSKN